MAGLHMDGLHMACQHMACQHMACQHMACQHMSCQHMDGSLNTRHDNTAGRAGYLQLFAVWCSAS